MTLCLHMWGRLIGCLFFLTHHRSLEQVLGWRVKIIDINSVNSFEGEVRSSMENVKTYITFITMDMAGAVVPSKDVKR